MVREKARLIGVDWRARLVGKSLTIGALVLLLSALYLLLIWLLAARFDLTRASIDHMLATGLIAILVVPLHNWLSSIVNRLLRHQWQSSQDLLREIGLALSRTIDPDELHTILVDDLPARLHIQSATLWILEPPTDHAFVALGQPHDHVRMIVLSNGSTARQLSSATRHVMIDDLSMNDRAPFVIQQIQLLIPLFVGDRLIGIYGCGAPYNEGRYPKRVIELLMMLAPAAASALENGRAYMTIARLNEELRALDQLKGEFIQSVGHELRTPLTSLSLAVQMLAGQRDMPLNLTNITRTGVTLLQALVDRVLEFDLHLSSPPENTHMDVVAPVEIAPVLTEIVSWYTSIAEAKGMRFITHIASDLAALGHPASLRRALHEVIDNAVRYSDGGAITLAAALYDGLVVVSIADEGPGIPHEEQARLFTAFYRGRGTRALSGTPGAGLGLSIARRDIEAIGGQIWLDRSGPAGSTMCVALPAAALEESAPLSAEQVRTVGG